MSLNKLELRLFQLHELLVKVKRIVGTIKSKKPTGLTRARNPRVNDTALTTSKVATPLITQYYLLIARSFRHFDGGWVDRYHYNNKKMYMYFTLNFLNNVSQSDIKHYNKSNPLNGSVHIVSSYM